MSIVTTDLWREFSGHYLMMRSWEQQSPEAFRAFVEQFGAVLAQWLYQHRQRKAKPDPLLQLSELRLLADMIVRNVERDKGFAQARNKVVSTLDAWWEQFKQEHDGPQH